VIFLNFVKNEDLSRYYNAADIGVWPGANSITAIESIGTGLPIIVPENDLAYKILFDAYAAIGFKRKNVDDLAHCIAYLVKDEHTRKKISVHGISLAENVLSWEKVAEKSIKLYQNEI